jgi:hypothetical protein
VHRNLKHFLSNASIYRHLHVRSTINRTLN